MASDFYEMVYSVVALIPHGRVTSYGAIAKYLGASRSSRLVGYAMNNCHLSRPDLPAHRVVNRNGLLTGKHHFSNPFAMQQLLEAEGVVVVEDQIRDFKSRFWDPQLELTL